MTDLIKRALARVGITPETPRSEAAGALRSFGIALDTHCSDKQIMVGGSWITAQQLLDASALLSHAEAQASALDAARKALEKCGGSEAVTLPFYIRDNREGLELKARMDIARNALAQLNALEG